MKTPWRRLKTNLAGFVLSDFVLGVFFAVPAFAVGPTGFGNIDLRRRTVSNSFLPSVTVLPKQSRSSRGIVSA